MLAHVAGGGNPADADQFKGQTAPTNHVRKEPHLRQRRFANGLASDAPSLPIKHECAGSIFDPRGDAVYHHQCIGMRRHGLTQLFGQSVVEHVADFDEQRF